MNIKRKVSVFAAVFGLVAMFILSRSPTGRVSLVVHGFETNGDGIAARVEFTNSTQRAISYEGTSIRPEYRLFEAASGIWKEKGSTIEIVYLGAAEFPRPRTLLPSHGVVFQVWIPRKPEIMLRKVAVMYSHPRPTNGLWKVLPQWIPRRFPWSKDSYTLESEFML